jgi:hypothetical protein
MNPPTTHQNLRTRIIFTAGMFVCTLILLLWAHFHGGVTTHHVLQQGNLPGISNWWNLLLLPLLTWITTIRIQQRISKSQLSGSRSVWKGIITRFLIALILGITISISFLNDFQPVLQNVPYVFLLLSLFVPIFFMEFMLGFVLGMVFTFGAALPTAFMLVLSAFGWIIYTWIRPLFLRLFSTVIRRSTS